MEYSWGSTFNPFFAFKKTAEFTADISGMRQALLMDANLIICILDASVWQNKTWGAKLWQNLA